MIRTSYMILNSILILISWHRQNETLKNILSKFCIFIIKNYYFLGILSIILFIFMGIDILVSLLAKRKKFFGSF